MAQPIIYATNGDFLDNIKTKELTMSNVSKDDLELMAREAMGENVDMDRLLDVLYDIVNALNDIRDVIVQK
jgi:hypothetical protein